MKGSTLMPVSLLLLSYCSTIFECVSAFTISTRTVASDARPTSHATRQYWHSSPTRQPIGQQPISSRAISHRLYSAANEEKALDPADAPPFTVTLEKDNYSYQDAIQRTLGWVGAACIFGGGLWAVAGSNTGQEFFAGYLVEQSLSVDNLFVFLLLFEYFKVPLAYQDRVLNWGIYGAVVMRAVMIGLGAAALQNFHAILLLFAGILVYGSAKFFLDFGGEEKEEDPSQNSIVLFSRSLIKSTDDFDGDRFFTLVDGVRMATPLFICMIAVEISDVVFAIDSIPAVFGVTEVRFQALSTKLFLMVHLCSRQHCLRAALMLLFLFVDMIESFGGVFVQHLCYNGTPIHVHDSV
jgi:TerC family integral membrane protein